MLDSKGMPFRDAVLPDVSRDEARRMLETMVVTEEMDDIMYSAQRQGRISFYMTCDGEEGAAIGVAAGLDDGDQIYSQYVGRTLLCRCRCRCCALMLPPLLLLPTNQPPSSSRYREQGALMYRGFGLQRMADQCFSTKDDMGKGRQMPVHYGAADLNFHTISSPLTTQLPQAAGSALALRLAGEDQIVACFFGEGAASEGDFHAGLNFAAVLNAPVMFICRNNGFAISTKSSEQFRGDGIAPRALGYGMKAMRVDGNDALAVLAATRTLRAHILEKKEPVLLELMSYRGGHHSTSDDASRYRTDAEVKAWEGMAPVGRFAEWMKANGHLEEGELETMRADARKATLAAVESSESKGPPDVSTLFEDVYDGEMPKNLQRQKKELDEHLAKYPNAYGEGH